MHFDVNGVKKTIKSTIGGKQGDLLFPDLFNLHIAAIMMIWRKRRQGRTCKFRTKQDFIMGSGNRGDRRKRVLKRFRAGQSLVAGARSYALDERDGECSEEA